MVGDSMMDVETARPPALPSVWPSTASATFAARFELDGTELIARRPEDVARVIEAFLRALDLGP